MRLTKLNEAKTDLTALQNEIIEKDIRFNKAHKAINELPSRVMDAEWRKKGIYPTLKKLIKICMQEENLSALTADEFINWVNYECDDTLAPLAFTYSELLDNEHIYNLLTGDPEIERIIFDMGKKYGYIDKEGYEKEVDLGLGEKPTNKVKLTFRELLMAFLNEDFNNSLKELENAYWNGSLIESLICESEEDPEEEAFDDSELAMSDEEVAEINEPFEKEEEEVADVNVEEEPKEETDVNVEVESIAYSGMINQLIQNKWNMISEIKSVIATMESSYEDANKENIQNILNSIVDDITINIGMLHKVITLVDNSSGNLLQSGEEKAENIIK